MTSTRSVLLLVAAAAAVAACGPTAGPPVWVRDVKPLFDAKCAGCHQVGRIGPFPLTSYDEVVGLLPEVEASVVAGSMPPWPVSVDCNSYQDDKALSDTERALLAAWFEAGAPRGEGPEPQTQALTDPFATPIRPDVVLDAASEPYLPDEADDYRCFAMAWPFDDARFITGFDVVPGDPQNVHHVNVFLNPPAESPDDDFLAFDAADPLPGYRCGLGARVLQSALVGSWAPGASGLAYPQGTGQLVEPGSTITMEIHYASGAPGPDLGVAADLTSLVLQVDASVERRAMGAAFWWFNHWNQGGMEIPAGEPEVTHEVTIDPQLEVAVVAPWLTERLLDVHIAAVHMHQLGRRGTLRVLSPVGDTCLVDIRDWDYHWQVGFQLAEPAELFLGEDTLHLSCTWDNSLANQPEVDGVRQAPRTVNWGGGVADEMCIGFLYIVPAALP